MSKKTRNKVKTTEELLIEIQLLKKENEKLKVIKQDPSSHNHQRKVERRKTEKELHNELKLNKMLLNSLPHPAMVISKDREVLALNKIAEDLNVSVGSFCWEEFGQCLFIPEENTKKYKESGLVMPGTHCSFCQADKCLENRNSMNDPEVSAFGRIFDTYWIAIDEDKYLHYAIDITERKQAEDTLRQRTHDLDERVKELDCLYMLSKLVEKPGITIDEILKGTVDIIPSAWQYPDITGVKAILNDKEFKTANYKDTKWTQTADIVVNKKKIGELNVTYLEKRPVCDEGPFLKDERNLINALSERLGRIFERIITGDALLKNQEMLNRFMDSATEGFALYDSKLNLTMMNKTSLNIIGRKIEDIIGGNILEISPGLKNSKRYNMYKEVINTGKPITLVDVISLPGIQKKYLHIKAFKVGEGLGFSFSDITDSKKAEEEKILLEDRLQQAQKMEAIGTLAGGVAHDFNNILGIIMGYSELTLEDPSDTIDVIDNIKHILKASERAKDMVKQILAFSRKDKQTMGSVNTGKVIKEVVHFLKSSIPATIEIRSKVKKKSGFIFGNSTQINRVLLNLCTNAAHAMKKNGGVLEINLDEVVFSKDSSVSIDLHPGKYQKLTVSDTGTGMSQEIFERIFDPYFTTKDVGEGTGMGLAVTYGIIKSHKGEIKVYSKLGKGTVIDIYLPLYETVKTENNLGEPQDQIRGNNEKILFVDDERMLVELGTKMLKNLGYIVDCRVSSVEALQTFKVSPDEYDLIISDMTMPDMTGVKLAKEIHKIRPDLPIILCTGYSSRINKNNYIKKGISALVSKPVNKSELSKVIRNVLDKKKKNDTIKVHERSK